MQNYLYLSFFNLWIEDQFTNELSHTVTFAHFENILTVIEHDNTNITPVVSVNDSSWISQKWIGLNTIMKMIFEIYNYYCLRYQYDGLQQGQI